MLIIGVQKEYIKNLIEKLWVNIMICMFTEIHYCLQTYSKTFKKYEIKLKLLMNIGILLMVEKGIRGEMCHGRAIANNKYIKNFDKKYRIIIKIIKTLIYLDGNNLHG